MFNQGILAAAVAAALASGSIIAADTGTRGGSAEVPAYDSADTGAAMPGAAVYGADGFDSIDRDGNGVISREEARAADSLIGNWEQVDEDGSGSIDRAEFAQFEPELDQQRTGSLRSGVSDMQDEEQLGDLTFGDIDVDGDRRISRQEAEAHPELSQAWRDWDTNLDDYIEEGEFAAFEQSAEGTVEPGAEQRGFDEGVDRPTYGDAGATDEPIGTRAEMAEDTEGRLMLGAHSFDDLDQNNDGVISRAEARDAKGLIDNWEQVDRDASGDVDEAEIAAFEEERQDTDAMQQPQTNGETGMQDMQGRQQQPTSREVIGELPQEGVQVTRKTFEELDTDGDGMLSKDEVSEALTARWDSLDRDGDGDVSRAEFAAFEPAEGNGEYPRVHEGPLYDRAYERDPYPGLESEGETE